MCGFEIVVEMLDISNLNIEIKAYTQFLYLNVVNGVYLGFKLCNSRNFTTGSMYVNLKYILCAAKVYMHIFATPRDKE